MRTQVDKARIRDLPLDDLAGKVEPYDPAGEDLQIGGDGDAAAPFHFGIDLVGHHCLHRDGETARGAVDEGGHPPAVGNGAVEEPLRSGDPGLFERFCGQGNSLFSLGPQGISAVDIGDVAVALIRPDKDNAAAQRRFEGDKQVEPSIQSVFPRSAPNTKGVLRTAPSPAVWTMASRSRSTSWKWLPTSVKAAFVL